MRLDLFMTEDGIVSSRNKAQSLIKNGMVEVDGKTVLKPSFDVNGDEKVSVTENIKFVGRGGLKLEAALDSFGISPLGCTVVDIGASTGGFTDCLLQRGAGLVFAVDSGRDQLVPELRNDDRVKVMEMFNARNLSCKELGTKCHMAVMDVSFISQRLLYKNVRDVLYDGGVFVSLIKPQFEAGIRCVGKGGIVRDEREHLRVIKELFESASAEHLYACGIIRSPIKGGDGNIEYLAYFRHSIKDGAISRDITDGYIEKVVFQNVK